MSGVRKIQFKYHPNVYELDIFFKAEEGEFPVCECCGRETEYSYERIYAIEEVNCLCPECIASGKAAEKFDGTFIQGAEDDKVDDPEKVRELYERTPGYHSWQGEEWLACCNDYCAFIGYTDIDRLNEMGIADEVLDKFDEDTAEFIRNAMTENGHIYGYLFRCLHCGKYHLGTDAD